MFRTVATSVHIILANISARCSSCISSGGNLEILENVMAALVRDQKNCHCVRSHKRSFHIRSGSLCKFVLRILFSHVLEQNVSPPIKNGAVNRKSVVRFIFLKSEPRLFYGPGNRQRHRFPDFDAKANSITGDLNKTDAISDRTRLIVTCSFVNRHKNETMTQSCGWQLQAKQCSLDVSHHRIQDWKIEVSTILGDALPVLSHAFQGTPCFLFWQPE